MAAPKYEWKGFEPIPVLNAAQTPFGQHPQTIDQRYLTSWNNKQARGYRAADDNFGFSSTYRSKLLDSRIKPEIKGKRKMSLAELIDAAEDAGTVDLRGDTVLKHALAVIRSGKVKDPELRGAIAELQAWRRAGSHRRDADADGTYEHANAIRIMDAWWPLLLEAEFEPTLGTSLFEQLKSAIGFDDPPRAQGSAYQSGWYGYASKDLRTVLGKKVKGEYSRTYCGGGKLRKCRQALASSLNQALAVPASELYGTESCEGGDPQWCSGAVRFRALGAVTQPPMHWINRPTFQQAVEVEGK
jgi:hypothetical protein